MTLKHYWTYAYALEKAGRYNVSQPLISQLSQIDTSGNAYYWRYRIAQAHGNIPESLLMLEQSVTKNNTEVTDMLKQSLALSQRDYYESQFRESSLKIRVKNQVIIFVFILSVLIILVIVLCVQKYLSEHRKEKENLLAHFHPDYKQEEFDVLKIGPNKGEKVPKELAALLQAHSRISADSVCLDKGWWQANR